MRHALSSTHNRQIEVIELLRAANNFVSVKKLAELVDAVPKAILNDCIEIEDQWNDIVQIEKNASGDLQLSEKDNHTIREVFSAILKDSPTFQLLEILFFQPGKLRTDLEKELFLSSSSLYRRIVKLNEGLEMRGLQVDRNNLMLVGEDELQVRLFMSGYFLEVYDVYEWPFQLDQKALLAMVTQLNNQFDLKLNFLQKTEFTFLLAVSLIRQKQGFLSNYKRKPLLSEKTTQYKESINKLMTCFSLPITEDGRNDLIQTIFWYDFAWDNAEEEARIERFCSNTLSLIIDALGITISETSRKNCLALLKSVYNSYKAYPYENYIAYNRQLYNSLTIQRDFTVFSKVLEKTLKDQETKSRFPWYTMYYHLILFEFFIYWEKLPEQLDALKKHVLIEICSDLGARHAQLLAYYLDKSYHNKVLLDVQSDKIYSEVAPESLISDLYVTNFSTPLIPEERLFVLEDVLSAKNLSALGRKIEEYRMSTLIKRLTYLN
ncbi:helix-turn-helix domain-containing protein [Enterococcus raffinosus]|uniref:helix-turn-helix domain-containing protein n=1 Tax=Enterococcus raffinosus TaxID=71452 RepID=UPI00288CD7D5|nr:helix-turn-helix domain-containing protein [Enterococcus raffinosus]MDT2522479.1 helix-turn-helix domain-containing protein [Enterococcus raffinosus]MDT2530430.1 helix-turn-helix domain-containing protein [Enterococcus raffinosus]MDT2533604.1 helix-turn-helix domain-containing protein [Enterococcus raffinosus]MDT2591141.1 helix-turn-helix domain-containing protein [Enterococcus raffinosus]